MFLLSAAVFGAIGALAAPSPWPASAKLSTHRTHLLPRGESIDAYFPPSYFETYGQGGRDFGLAGRADLDTAACVSAFVASRLNVSEDKAHYRSGHSSDGVTYAYLAQHHNDIELANAAASVAFAEDGRVLAFGSSFVELERVAGSVPSVPLDQAITAAELALDGQFNGHPPSLKYVVQADHSAVLAHVIQIQNDDVGSWYDAFVDAHSGTLVSVVNYVSHATYKVLNLPKQSPDQRFDLITNPEDASSSPKGWVNTTETSGNNAKAYGRDILIVQESAPGNFSYDFDPSSSTVSRPASVVNAFYIVNTMHDIAYQYGFTEAAFNFQDDNYGQGGAGNDYINIWMQNTSSINNADFTALPDGQPGRLRSFMWNKATPSRDSGFDNGILVHEATHGITERLTGGGTAACLQSAESKGLGEGWSDAVADWTAQTSAPITDYVIGSYVWNASGGLRKYSYSTNVMTNPLRYSSLAGRTEVHDIGEVWANMLHQVQADLVDAYGFDLDARRNPDSSAGNVVWFHLFIDGLKLQPCHPTFLSARDAFIQADANRYQAANKCLLWRAFASKGMGVGAQDYVDNAAVPDGC